MKIFLLVALMTMCNASKPSTISKLYNSRKKTQLLNYVLYTDLLKFERMIYNFIDVMVPLYEKTDNKLSNILTKYNNGTASGKINFFIFY